MRTMPLQRQRDQERQAHARNDDYQGGETQMYVEPSLPEEVWCHIHSLMSMRDAARAACVSRAFLHSWRCHPNLTFSNTTLGLNKKACGNDDTSRDFSSKVDGILKKHSGIGVKKLKIMLKDYNVKDSCYLDSWLQIAVTPGIEELALTLPMEANYNFPYSVISNGSGDSIRYICLAWCSFHPRAEFGWLRNLTRLHLRSVYITGDELECLLSNSFALERLEIRYCDGIVCLKIPCMLEQLSHIKVHGCGRLLVLDSRAPNISSFYFDGDHRIQLSLGETLQMQNLTMSFSGAVHYTRVELPSSMPNLKTGTIYSRSEMANTPMLHSKYLHLNKLSIVLSAVTFPPDYDYYSLVSFLDACPSLETLALDVSQQKMEHASICTDPSDLRRMREHHHHKMKNVRIPGFTSAKSLIELTCHVVENVTSLKRLTLEAHQSSFRCYVPDHKCSKCSPLSMDVLKEAHRALTAIRTYIEPQVPSTAKLHVVKPCSRCHTLEN